MSIYKCLDELPKIAPFDYCAPEYAFGEIDAIIIGHMSLAEGDVYPADESEANDWEPLLDRDPGTGEAAAYLLYVRGTLTEPDQQEIESSGRRWAYPDAEWTIDARVDELSADIYESLRHYRNKIVRLWFIAGGFIFGGNEGIPNVTVNTHVEIDEGFDTMHHMVMRLKWRSGDIPARSTAPELGEEPVDE